MQTKLEISRGPKGLQLHMPSGRTIDISASEAGARFIEELLRNADNHARYGEKHTPYAKAFPTQEIADIWARGQAQQASIKKQVEEIKAQKKEAAARELRESFSKRGINFDALDFNI